MSRVEGIGNRSAKSRIVLFRQGSEYVQPHAFFVKILISAPHQIQYEELIDELSHRVDNLHSTVSKIAVVVDEMAMAIQIVYSF